MGTRSSTTVVGVFLPVLNGTRIRDWFPLSNRDNYLEMGGVCLSGSSTAHILAHLTFAVVCRSFLLAHLTFAIICRSFLSAFTSVVQKIAFPAIVDQAHNST
jgi:hypothetical protein